MILESILLDPALIFTHKYRISLAYDIYPKNKIRRDSQLTVTHLLICQSKNCVKNYMLHAYIVFYITIGMLFILNRINIQNQNFEIFYVIFVLFYNFTNTNLPSSVNCTFIKIQNKTTVFKLGDFYL